VPRETIAAIATATGVGGVGIVRLSGADALVVAAAVTGRDPARWEDRRLHRVQVRDQAERRLDDGLAVWMRGPGSFTGEDVVELQVHGGSVNLGRILGAVLEAGARQAEPGEFTRRALEAGKIDVVTAEAMLAVVHAQSERGWALAQANLAGGLAARVARVRAELALLLAEHEALLDFPDERLERTVPAQTAERIRRVAGACRQLEAGFGAGRAMVDGMVVALVGHVNAGKSSLFNALLGSERALVSPEPGTTRDWVEARALWRGVPVALIDTAGEREDVTSAVNLEQRGIELGRQKVAEAHVVLAVTAPNGPPALDGWRCDHRVIWVSSKVDVGGCRPGFVATSARTGEGIEALRDQILARVGVVDDVEAGSGVVLTERQRSAVAAAASSLEAAAATSEGGDLGELVALELRAGLDALAKLMGERVGEEVLDELFARFCIGK